MTTDDLERRLREGLRREAERIKPRERRAEILAMVHDETHVIEPRRRWLIPIAAAASVALIGAVIWGVPYSGGSRQITPARAVPNPLSSANGTVLGATQVVLPAYFVGANSGTRARYGLYREFVRTAVPGVVTPAQKARAALTVAMNAQPFARYEPYLQPWSATSVKNLTVAPGRITITLSGPGAPGFTAEQTRLAVQELVWTAQAAIGKGPIPVKFVVAGSAKLFGTYSTAGTYNRPAKDLQYQVLAPIWITSPERSQVFPTGALVVARGESCAFEGTTAWQLKKGGTAVKSGVTMASSGCPMRGTWMVKLGVLGVGNYTFRMYEVSMESGQGVVAETSKPFTVE
jgi:Immunoglobulin-like domain of bacterial spore germination